MNESVMQILWVFWGCDNKAPLTSGLNKNRLPHVFLGLLLRTARQNLLHAWPYTITILEIIFLFTWLTLRLYMSLQIILLYRDTVILIGVPHSATMTSVPLKWLSLQLSNFWIRSPFEVLGVRFLTYEWEDTT